MPQPKSQRANEHPPRDWGNPDDIEAVDADQDAKARLAAAFKAHAAEMRSKTPAAPAETKKSRSPRAKGATEAPVAEAASPGKSSGHRGLNARQKPLLRRVEVPEPPKPEAEAAKAPDNRPPWETGEAPVSKEEAEKMVKTDAESPTGEDKLREADMYKAFLAQYNAAEATQDPVERSKKRREILQRLERNISKTNLDNPAAARLAAVSDQFREDLRSGQVEGLEVNPTTGDLSPEEQAVAKETANENAYLEQVVDFANKQKARIGNELLARAADIDTGYYHQSRGFVDEFDSRSWIRRKFASSKDRMNYNLMKGYINAADEIAALVQDQYLRKDYATGVPPQHPDTPSSVYNPGVRMSTGGSSEVKRIADRMQPEKGILSPDSEQQWQETEDWTSYYKAMDKAAEKHLDKVPQELLNRLDAIDSATYASKQGIVQMVQKLPVQDRLEHLANYMQAKRYIKRADATLKELRSYIPVADLPGARSESDLEDEFFNEEGVLEDVSDLYDDGFEATEDAPEVHNDEPTLFVKNAIDGPPPVQEGLKDRESGKVQETDSRFFVRMEKGLEAVEDSTDPTHREVMINRLREQLNAYKGDDLGVRDSYLAALADLEKANVAPDENGDVEYQVDSERTDIPKYDVQFFANIGVMIDKAQSAKNGETRRAYYDLARMQLLTYNGDSPEWAENLIHQINELQNIEDSEAEENARFFSAVNDQLNAIKSQTNEALRNVLIEAAEISLANYSGSETKLLEKYQKTLAHLKDNAPTVNLDTAADMVQPEEGPVVEAIGVGDAEEEPSIDAPELEVEMGDGTEEYRDELEQELNGLLDTVKGSRPKMAKQIVEHLHTMEEELDQSAMSEEEFNEMVGTWLQNLREDGDGHLVDLIVEEAKKQNQEAA